MATEGLDSLLEAMPRIAKAVNAFDNQDVQAKAFDALVAAFGQEVLGEPNQGGEDLTNTSGSDEANGRGKSRKPRSRTAKTSAKKKASKSTSGKKLSSPPMDGSIVLAPQGKKSLTDFVKEKAPKTMVEKSMIIVYWLANELKIKDISTSQVYTCYKRMGWPAPSDPSNQLQIISSVHKYLETSNMESITLTHAGSEFVQHHLPRTKAGK